MAVGTAFLKLLITGGLIIATIASFVNENNSPVIKINITHYDLPDYIKPSHYDIKLIPDIKDGYFYGESNITIYINRTTQTIYLHSAYLTIFDVQLENAANTIYEPSLSLDYKKQIAILNFDDILSKSPTDGLKQGTYILRMKFVGAIYENIGLFRISQNNEWLFGTRNQARRIFPCWDDPAFKATFNISVQHEEGYVALSNMPLSDLKAGLNNEWRQFEKTPLMSTDRVGIVVTNFCKKNERPRNTRWSRCIGQVSQFTDQPTSFVIKNVINYLKKDWKSLYKVPKMNYFIVPNFPDEISQTWGLIFYREKDVIYDVEEGSPTRELEVMRSVTRGITNQLVEKLFASSSSWTNLWLNEGFNIFFGEYVLDKIIPDSLTMDLFVIETQHEALHFNTPLHKYTHFEKDYTDLKEIKSDALIRLSRHTKAPVLWRVLQNVIPEKVFWSAIRTYLKTYTFNNSSRSPENLWAIMQASLEFDHKYTIKQLMDNWTAKNHYPILNVNRYYDLMTISCDSQEKEYWIPVTYTVQSQCNFNKTWPDNHHWLTHLDPELSFHLPEIDYDNWAIVNIQQTGFYRVNYDVLTWNKIARYLKSENYTKIHVLNRAQLIDDAFHLALQRKLKFSLFFQLGIYLERERDYVAWYPMFKALEYMSCVFLFPREPFLAMFAKFIVFDLEKKILKRKSETGNYLTERLRYEGHKWACILDSPICTKRASIILTWHLNDPIYNNVETEWKEWMFCKGLKKAKHYVWDRMYHMYYDHDVFSQYLVCSEDPQIIMKYLRIMFKEALDAKRRLMTDYAEVMQHRKIRIKNFLSILARHVRQYDVVSFITYYLEDYLDTISIPKPEEVNTIAALIIILNHVKPIDLVSDEMKEVTRYILKKKKIDPDFGNSKIEWCRHNIMIRFDRQNRMLNLINPEEPPSYI